MVVNSQTRNAISDEIRKYMLLSIQYKEIIDNAKTRPKRRLWQKRLEKNNKKISNMTSTLSSILNSEDTPNAT